MSYAQQSKDRAKVEQDILAKRIQEFRTQAELDSIRASSNIDPSAGVDNTRAFGMNSYKNVETVLPYNPNGEVTLLLSGIKSQMIVSF